MLGRLEMSIEACIEAYSDMMDGVFNKVGHRVGLWGNVKGRFDTAALEKAIRKVVKDSGRPETTKMRDPNAKCKVYVSDVLLNSWKTVN